MDTQPDNILYKNKIVDAMEAVEADSGKPDYWLNRAKPKTPKYKLPKAVKKLQEKGKLNDIAKRITKRVESDWNPFVSDYFMKAYGGERNVYRPTKELFCELFENMVKMADVLTGILPYSSITSLSDQCGVTQYGQAYYVDGERVYDENGNNPVKPPEGSYQKKSISRTWRLLEMAKDCDLVRIVTMRDKITGAELPAIIQLKDTAYYIYGETEESLAASRRKRIGWLKKTNQLYVPADQPMDVTIDNMRDAWLENIKLSREAHRRKIRLVNMIGGLDEHNLWKYGQKCVNAAFDKAERAAMSIAQYQYQVTKVIDDLWKEIRGLEETGRLQI